MPKSIYVIDDDALLRRSLTFTLGQAGYAVTSFGSAEEALAAIREHAPDLILLDIGLPGMDGLEAIRRIHDGGPTPVIFLTARRRELDEVLGLELGADDYVTKPFDKDVLLARIRTALRKSPFPPEPNASAGILAGDISIEPEKHTVFLRGAPLSLSPKEYDLLVELARKAGKLVKTEDLLSRVWGDGFQGQPQVLYVHIRWLREKMEEDPDHPTRIVTIRGLGYQFVPKEY